MEKRTSLSVPQALRQVMQVPRPLDQVRVPLLQSLGLILAEPVCTKQDIPHYNRSAYDGYAIRSIDTTEASHGSPVVFEVVDEIPAGSVSTKIIGAFQTARIMTGAAIPDGADAVIMQELVQDGLTDGKRTMTLKRKLKPGENVSSKGEEAKQGEKMLEPGTLIQPGTIALLASLGCAQVWVHRKPVFGVIATGTELLEVEDSLEHGKIRNSNASMVCAQIERAGGESRYYGKVQDDFASTLAIVQQAMQECDAVITTGGVSVGDYDYMPDVYQAIDAHVLFNKIGMRPGSVTTVAESGGKLLFGLSGNPSACFVGFELYARPALRTMLGSNLPYVPLVKGILGADFPKPNPFTRFVRARTSYVKGRIYAEPVGLDKSSSVTSLAYTNALIVLPGGSRGYAANDEIHILLLDDLQGADFPWPDEAERED